MGIKDLFKVVFDNKKMISDVVIPVKWTDLTDKFVLVDAFNIIYSSIGVGGDSFVLTDSTGRVTKHINIIIQKIAKMVQYNIGQIWIFDGESHELKSKEQAKRRETRRFTVSEEQINEVKHLLKLCGVTYIESPAGLEAEVLAARLTNIKNENGSRKYSAVISNDTDVIVCGGILLTDRNIKSKSQSTKGSGKGNKKLPKNIMGYVLNPVLMCKELGITQEQLLDIGLALGTDFNDKVKGVGPKTVVKKVKEGSIEWNEESIVARAHIKNMITRQVDDLAVISEVGDRPELEKFLKSRDFNMDKISKTLNTLFPSS